MFNMLLRMLGLFKKPLETRKPETEVDVPVADETLSEATVEPLDSDEDLVVIEPRIPVNSLSLDDIIHTFKTLGYRYHSSDDNKLNIVGVRNTDVLDSNEFNDHLYVWYYDRGTPLLFHCPITTDPGVYYRYNNLNTAGTAIVVPGQHRDLWRVGMHQGKYKALVQNKPVLVYRDADKNGTIDITPATVIATGFFGINLHRTIESGVSKLVDKWSAGCQVIPNSDHYGTLMRIIDLNFPYDTFCYTLLTQDQLVRAPG